MKVHAQLKNDFLVEVGTKKQIPFGYIVDLLKEEVDPPQAAPIYSFLRSSPYWDVPKISEKAEKRILELVEKHIEKNKED